MENNIGEARRNYQINNIYKGTKKAPLATRKQRGEYQRQNFLAKDTQPMITLFPAVWCPQTRDGEHRDDRDETENRRANHG